MNTYTYIFAAKIKGSGFLKGVLRCDSSLSQHLFHLHTRTLSTRNVALKSCKHVFRFLNNLNIHILLIFDRDFDAFQFLEGWIRFYLLTRLSFYVYFIQMKVFVIFIRKYFESDSDKLSYL